MSVNDLFDRTPLTPEQRALAKLEELERLPGLQIAFDPDEAEAAGAIVDDAVSEEDARLADRNSED